MDNKSVLKQFFDIGVGTIVVVVIQSLTTPIITRMVAPDEYGVQSMFLSYCSLIVSFIYIGMDQSFIRYYYNNESQGYKSRLLFRCLKPAIIIYVAFSTIIVIIKSTEIIQINYSYYFIVCALIYIAISVFDRFISLSLRLDYKTKYYSLTNILSKLSHLIMSVTLVIIFGSSATVLIISTIIASLITSFVRIFLQRDMFKGDKTYCNLPPLKELMIYGLPFTISYGIGALLEVIDRFSINYWGSYTEVGIYSSALNIVGIFSVIQTTFGTLWSPLAIKHYEDDPNDTSFYVRGHYTISLIVWIAGFLLVSLRGVIVYFLGAKYREASYLLPFLLLNPIMWTASETTVSGLFFKKKSKLQIVPPLAACLMNIIGNSALVPLLGYKGAAISTGCSYILFFVLRTILGQRYYNINANYKKFLLITVVYFAYAIYSTFNEVDITCVLLSVFGILLTVFLYRGECKMFICRIIKGIRERGEK